MMGPRQVAQGALFYEFSIEDHVPSDHLLRRIDRFLDLSGIRSFLAPFYSAIGRPSIYLELMIRMLIVGYSCGIRSERQLCEEVHLNLAYRWFCRLDMADPVRLVPARHEPPITLETWQKIQERRSGTASAPARKNISADFPLRGLVLCGDGNEPLTACWSTGRRKKYPYYLCDTKGCVSYRKSIPRQRIEEEFSPIVQALQPTEGLLQLALRMFRVAWDRRLSQAADIERALKADVARSEKEIGQLLDRIVEASSPAVVVAYEKRVEALELERKVAEEKLQAGTGPKRSFDGSFEHACTFLANSWKLWETGELALTRLVLKLAFVRRIRYRRNRAIKHLKSR